MVSWDGNQTLDHPLRRVIANYESEALDLTDPATFRDLSKPVGALNAKRLSFFKVSGWLRGLATGLSIFVLFRFSDLAKSRVSWCWRSCTVRVVQKI